MKRGGLRNNTGIITIVAGLALAGGLAGCAPDASTPPPPPTSGSSNPSPTIDAGLTPRGPTVSGTVERVVDGDTVRVVVDGQREDISVRLIGIDTPETVAPGRPVECFGPEASAFAEQILDGSRVLLEFDPTQGETDRFDRTLAYVWVVSPAGETTLFNLAAITGGYAREAQYAAPYAWQPEFVAAESAARAQGIGQWSAC